MLSPAPALASALLVEEVVLSPAPALASALVAEEVVEAMMGLAWLPQDSIHCPASVA